MLEKDKRRKNNFSKWFLREPPRNVTYPATNSRRLKQAKSQQRYEYREPHDSHSIFLPIGGTWGVAVAVAVAIAIVIPGQELLSLGESARI